MTVEPHQRPVDLHLEWFDSFDALSRKWPDFWQSSNPFMSMGFLRALEESQSIGGMTAWPIRVPVLKADNTPVLSAPMFIKQDSYGEFVFDFGWAEGFMRAGIPYYPKAVVAAPFTPATGPRIIGTDEHIAQYAEEFWPRVLDDLYQQGVHSVHALFHSDECLPGTADRTSQVPFMVRTGWQYHWHNQNYSDFQDWLAALRSQKRKQIKKERKSVAQEGVEVRVYDNDRLQPEHMQRMEQFYRANLARRGSPQYLTHQFFACALKHCREQIVYVEASRNRGDSAEPIAGAIAWRNAPSDSSDVPKALYGRYWGAIEGVRCLHFEVSYYALIEYAIAENIDIFEAGAQGEHKFLRGFDPVPTYSSHAIFHPQGREAVRQFLEQEREQNSHLIEQYRRISPDKRVRSSGANVVDR